METIATRFAVCMMDAKSLDDLRVLWQEVNHNKSKFSKEWYEWLIDVKDGNKIRLEPDVEPTWLTKEGLSWWHSQTQKSNK